MLSAEWWVFCSGFKGVVRFARSSCILLVRGNLASMSLMEMQISKQKVPGFTSTFHSTLRNGLSSVNHNRLYTFGKDIPSSLKYLTYNRLEKCCLLCIIQIHVLMITLRHCCNSQFHCPCNWMSWRGIILGYVIFRGDNHITHSCD